MIALRRTVGRFLGPPHLDEVVMVNRVIGGRAGVMIDVGAHHGYAADPFIEQGWVVHAFEPDPANRSILKTRCPGITVDSRAISEADGEEVALFTSAVSTGISTLSPFHDSHKATATVRTVRLDTYIAEHEIANVDFLKIDIEGYDLFALRTFPWQAAHPRAVVCEYEDNKTRLLGHTVHDTAEFLQAQGYAVLVSEWHPIIEYGTRHTWRRFMRYPVEVSADSWGNLVAVDPELLEAVERSGHSAVRRLRIRRVVDRLRGR